VDLDDKTGLEDRLTSPPVLEGAPHVDRPHTPHHSGDRRPSHVRGSVSPPRSSFRRSRSPRRDDPRRVDPHVSQSGRGRAVVLTPTRDTRSRSPTLPLLPGASRGPLHGLGALEAMANDSPVSGNFVDLVHERVQADVAEFSLESFVVDTSQKFKRRVTPSQALNAMKDRSDPAYKAVYAIYLKKLTTALDTHKNRRCKPWKAIEKVCEGLNIDVSGRDVHDLPKLLARLRGIDMTRKPL
jgi:hypothetical protein